MNQKRPKRQTPGRKHHSVPKSMAAEAYCLSQVTYKVGYGNRLFHHHGILVKNQLLGRITFFYF
jgi:hypothetical protein